MGQIAIAVGIFVLAFALGSIPFGLIISKLFFHTDIRKSGSGNIGTTNAMRSLGKKGGAAVFILDFGKGYLSGFLAAAIAAAFIPGDTGSALSLTIGDCTALAFMGCILGHIYSPWLGFHGGKGIAVAVGCLFVTFGFVGAWIELGLFIVLVLATRYVSVGSIAAAVACPFLSLYYFWGDWPAWACMTVGALAVLFAHRGNFQRLRQGNERRIGKKPDDAQNGGAA